MKRLYVFAMGGTGVRVIKSLVMLMATGELSDYEVVPIVIDFDVANGNLNETLALLDKYKMIHNVVIHYRNEDFFSSSLASIGDVANNTCNFRLNIPTVICTRVADLLKYDSLQPPFKQMVDSLITTGIYGEIYSDLRVGFKGNAKIARLGYAALKIQDSLEFRSLLNCICCNDKVVVVGSTFGDTGSVGVIEILKLLQRYILFHFENIAAVLVEPYFRPMHNPEMHCAVFNKRSSEFFNYYHELRMDSFVKATYRIGMDGFENVEYGGGSAKKQSSSCGNAICDGSL